ncbi:MAG TPA: oxygenase MpaB family protein [Rhodocyclaceae bacterium]|nr:oxygenase MpaB family protein [Rhodocyclaceae bacterium]
MSRHSVLHRIEQLDPERDHVRIYYLSCGYEFSWDTVRALEIALYRTYCVPSISRLLARTGEFDRRPQRRYDDTALLIAEITEWGYDSERGREAIDRINRIHAQFDIANDDLRYVLSTFVFEPIRWNARFGWRPMCEHERLASFHFWRAVGTRMGIRDIPETYDALERFNIDYERRHFRYADSNRRIGTATRELFVSWFPRVLAPLVRASIHALLDEAMLDAFGFRKPNAWFRRAVCGGLKVRAWAVRHLPPRKKAHFFSHDRNHSHPHGYRIDELGPPEFVARIRGQGPSAF